MIEHIFPERYDDLVAAWRSLRSERALRVREIACVGAPRTLLCVELGDPRRPPVMIAAGVHGDEPGGAWALLSLVRDGLLDPRFSYRLWPCSNPTGFDRGTRASADGIDLNRSFGRGGTAPETKAILTANRDHHFALVLDLHEDPEATGFYLYETAAADCAGGYAAALTSAVVEAGFGLQTFTAGFELGPPGSEAAQTRTLGAVVVDADAERPYFAGALPLGLLVTRRAVPCALTLETPRCAPPAARLAMHRVAVVTALARTPAP